MSENAPLVSVIMPVYNDEKYVEAAIKSILEQTLKDFELIVVNDGSTDGSKEVVERMTDSRIRLIDNCENRGRAHAVNCGFEVARGKYIAEMDADDISLPDRLMEQYEYMEKNEEIACCGTLVRTLIGFRTYPSPQAVKFEDLQAKILFCSPLAHSTWFIRGTEIRRGVRYHETFLLSQDYDLMARMMRSWKLGCIPKELLLYRVRKSQKKIVDPYTVKVTARILRSLHIKDANKSALLMRRFWLGHIDKPVECLSLLILMQTIIRNNRKYVIFDQMALQKMVYRQERKAFKSLLQMFFKTKI